MVFENSNERHVEPKAKHSTRNLQNKLKTSSKNLAMIQAKDSAKKKEENLKKLKESPYLTHVKRRFEIVNQMVIP